MGVLLTLQEERDRREPRVKSPLGDEATPDCLKPHVVRQFFDETCSADSAVTTRVLQFLLGASDVRDALPTRQQCEQMLIDLVPDEEKSIKQPLIVSLCAAMKEGPQ
jgi:hypothetical protein